MLLFIKQSAFSSSPDNELGYRYILSTELCYLLPLFSQNIHPIRMCFESGKAGNNRLTALYSGF